MARLLCGHRLLERITKTLPTCADEYTTTLSGRKSEFPVMNARGLYETRDCALRQHQRESMYMNVVELGSRYFVQALACLLFVQQRVLPSTTESQPLPEPLIFAREREMAVIYSVICSALC